MSETNDYAKGGYIEGGSPRIGINDGCYVPMSPAVLAIGKRNLEAMVKAMGNYSWPPEDPEADS